MVLSIQNLTMFSTGILETLYMTLVSTAISYVIGLPIGIALALTDKIGIHPKPFFNKTLGAIVNTFRSIPFLILLVMVMPITRAIVGTTLGSTAVIVPLVISAIPFIARMTESSIKEVDFGVIEAAQSMGASTIQIVWKVMLPESLPSLISGATIVVTTILGYSAMSGIVGGGGLGNIAVTYGYNRNEQDIMMIAVILLVVIVQVLQEVGMRLSIWKNKKTL